MLFDDHPGLAHVATRRADEQHGRRHPWFESAIVAGISAAVSAEPAYDEPAFQALVRAYVACRLAVDVLPQLPGDIREAVEGPVTALCNVVGPELERVRPGFEAVRRVRGG